MSFIGLKKKYSLEMNDEQYSKNNNNNNKIKPQQVKQS